MTITKRLKTALAHMGASISKFMSIGPRFRAFISGAYNGLIGAFSRPDFSTLADNVLRNPYSARALELIQANAASIRPYARRVVMEAGEAVEQPVNHPFLKLLYRPSPATGWKDFVQELWYNFFMGGENFIYAPGSPLTGAGAGRPRDQLILIPPYQVTEIIRAQPVETAVDAQGQTVERIRKDLPPQVIQYRVQWEDGSESLIPSVRIKHIRLLPDPERPGRGWPVAMKVWRSIKLMEFSDVWNLSVSQHRGRIPFILKYSGPGSLASSPEDFDRQQEEIDKAYQRRSRKSGPWLLEKNFDINTDVLKPTDADYVAGDKLNARKIAVGLGPDPSLLGDGENKTYSNFETALRAFFLLKIIPDMEDLLGELSAWYMPRYGTPDVFLSFDQNSITALQEDQKLRIERLTRATGRPIMATNEARMEMGLEPTDNGADDELWITSNMIPASEVSGIVNPLALDALPTAIIKGKDIQLGDGAARE